MALIAREKAGSRRSSSIFSNVLKEFEVKHKHKATGAFSEGNLICESTPKTLTQKLCALTKSDYLAEYKRKHSFLYQRSEKSLLAQVPDKKSEDDDVEELDVKYLPLTFIPNFIIEELLSDPDAMRSVPLNLCSHSVLVMVDVSGFTPLTEMYNRKEQFGAEDLATDLNNFMSNLAATLMSFGGDILNFAGDAFLCQWEGNKESDLPALSEQAFTCAVYIQTILSSDVRHVLRVKIGMSLGETKTQILGSPSEFLLFAVYGKALVTVRSAEELCGPSEIVISEEVLLCLKNRELKLYGEEYLKDGFVKISRFERELGSKPPLSRSTRLRLFQECAPQIIALTRAFMIPILRDVKTVDQLKYLSEVSNITILFVFLPTIDVEMPVNLDHSLESILSSVKNFGGVLNKVLLFDKGCTFLAIFGLPGLKHLDDASRSLLCAHDVVEGLKKYNLKVSTGISTGACFCGMIGHHRRQEYSVLGWRVNMACRLMTTYPDYQIVLDADTYHLSKQELGPECFTQLEKRKLKGIEDVPKVYSYHPLSKSEVYVETTKSVGKDVSVIIDEEYKKIQTILSDLKSKDVYEDISKSNKLPVIYIEGEKRSGKSFFLYHITEIAAALNYQILACCVTPEHVSQPFFTISKMLNKFFDILSAGEITKEELVLRFVPDVNDPYISCLNHLLGVKFSVHRNFCFQIAAVNKNIQRLLKAIISKLCKSDVKNPLLISIDDSDNMDPFSWYLLRDLMQSEHVVVLLSKTSNSKILCSTTPFVQMNAYHHIDLVEFREMLLVPMICWFFDVRAVHKDLVRFLKIHASNDSQFLEEILLCPIFISSINIVPMSEISSDSFENFEKTFDVKNADENESDIAEYNVCDIRSGVDLHTSVLSGNFQVALKERLNNLSIQDRVVLKRAAVLGFSFFFHLLEAASCDLTHTDLIDSVSSLVEQNILCCESSRPEIVPKKHPILIRLVSEFGYVSTKFMVSEESREHLQFLPFQKLQFRTVAFRACMLQHMTKDQTTSMHLEIVKDLQSQGLVCQECKHQQGVFRRRISCDTGEAEAKSELPLPIPALDLRKCSCLLVRGNAYSKIASIYNAIGSKFNSIAFLMKAAAAYLQLNAAVKALAYVQCGMNQFSPAYFRCDLLKVDLEIHPQIIKASLFRMKAEVLSLLWNCYDAASSAIEALKLLGICILEFYGNVSQKRLLKIAEKCSEPQRQEVARCLSVICLSYYRTGDYKTAYQLADCLILFIPKNSNLFCENLMYEILFYKCKSMEKPLTVDIYKENAILHCCHERLVCHENPVGVLEIEAVAKAYLALIQFNLNQRKLTRATMLCAEAIRLLKFVHESTVMPDILALGIQLSLHSKKLGYILTYLNNLRTFGVENDNKIYLGIFYCSILELSGSKIAQASLGDRMVDFNDFILAYDPSNFIVSKPRDMAYFVSSRLALWCLEVKLFSHGTKWVETFLYWYTLANLLKCKSTGSYWNIGANLSMIRINIIINFRIKDLTTEEKDMKFQELEDAIGYELWMHYRKNTIGNL